MPVTKERLDSMNRKLLEKVFTAKKLAVGQWKEANEAGDSIQSGKANLLIIDMLQKIIELKRKLGAGSYEIDGFESELEWRMELLSTVAEKPSIADHRPVAPAAAAKEPPTDAAFGHHFNEVADCDDDFALFGPASFSQYHPQHAHLLNPHHHNSPMYGHGVNDGHRMPSTGHGVNDSHRMPSTDRPLKRPATNRPLPLPTVRSRTSDSSGATSSEATTVPTKSTEACRPQIKLERAKMNSKAKTPSQLTDKKCAEKVRQLERPYQDLTEMHTPEDPATAEAEKWPKRTTFIVTYNEVKPNPPGGGGGTVDPKAKTLLYPQVVVRLPGPDDVAMAARAFQAAADAFAEHKAAAKAGEMLSTRRHKSCFWHKVYPVYSEDAHIEVLFKTDDPPDDPPGAENSKPKKRKSRGK